MDPVETAPIRRASGPGFAAVAAAWLIAAETTRGWLYGI
jgi:hypothetical protein